MRIGDMEPGVLYHHHGGQMIPVAETDCIEVPPDPSSGYDFRIYDSDGNLWGLTQELKRLDDLLSHYELSAVLVDRGSNRRVVLAHFITLTEDGPDGPVGPAESSTEPRGGGGTTGCSDGSR